MVGHRTDLDSIFAGITTTCVASFDADSVSLMLFEKDTEELVVRAAAGPQANTGIVGKRNELGEGLAGWAARRREPVLLSSEEDAGRYPGVKLRDSTINASMVVPIVVRDELVGVINVNSRNEEIRYNYEDLRTLEVFAENAGSCIRHVEQVSWLRTMVEQLRESGAQRASKERATP
jgi:GAF domain-containing protein